MPRGIQSLRRTRQTRPKDMAPSVMRLRQNQERRPSYFCRGHAKGERDLLQSHLYRKSLFFSPTNPWNHNPPEDTTSVLPLHIKPSELSCHTVRLLQHTTHKRAKIQQSGAVREQNGKNKTRYQDFNC